MELLLFVISKKLEKEKQTTHVVPSEIRQVLDKFQDVLVEELPPGLPPRRAIDHRIELVEGVPVHKIPHRYSYCMSPAKLEEARRQIKEYLRKGYIRPSVSPYGAPILFARRKDGCLRMCIDYRNLNGITKKNLYPLPRIDDLLDSLAGSRFFSKLDLASGYHQIMVAEEAVHKTAFTSKWDHYEWLVMGFGLTGAPGTFQGLMNDVSCDSLDASLLVYLDDILLYNQTL